MNIYGVVPSNYKDGKLHMPRIDEQMANVQNSINQRNKQSSQPQQPQANSPSYGGGQPSQPNWFELYNSLQGQPLAPSQSEISGVGNTVQTYTDRMKNAYSTQYNNSLANLGNARDFGIKRIDTQLGQAKQDLEDDRFQQYLASRQQMANGGLAGSGLMNDANARVQMHANKQLGRLTENAQLANEGVLNQYSAGLNDLNSQQAQYLATLSNQADSMYREMFGDLQSRYSQANQSQQSNAMKFMELLRDQYNADRNFSQLSAYQQAQLDQKDREFNSLSASEQARMIQDAYKFNNISATDLARMNIDMTQWGNISPYQQAQLDMQSRGQDITMRGQDITMRGQDLADARGWENINISRDRLNKDIETAISASNNKAIELQLKGLQNQYNGAQKDVDRLTKTKQAIMNDLTLDPAQKKAEIDKVTAEIAQAMANVKNAEQDIRKATTPYVPADNSRDMWYQNSNLNFNQQQGGSGAKPLANVKNASQAVSVLAPFAQKLESESGIPMAITMAQYLLESGGNPSGLARNHNNLFGVKAGSSWKGKTVTLPTKEVVNGKTITVNAKFRSYDSLEDAFRDRAQLLKGNRYKHLFQSNDPKQWAVGLQKAGYATDPQYANKLINIMKKYNLV